MTRVVLENKPLVEAIFELRWQLQEGKPGIRTDPHYKLLVGRMYDRLIEDYRFHEELPTARIPDEIAAYLVQHRFRKAEDQWPLVQLGPGVVTLNDTEGYTWDEFQKRIHETLRVLFESYPESEASLDVSSVQLRYIDGVEFHFDRDNILGFVKDHMKAGIQLNPKLFQGTDVGELPIGVDLQFAFSCRKPLGTIHLRFRRGTKDGLDALIWETVVRSLEDRVPKSEQDIIAWVDDAHELTDDWFFKTIEGELQRRFQ